jgi:hypothetical protein
MDDAGTYMVKAINIEGEAKCESLLNILPSITNTPMNNESINTQPINIQPNDFPPPINIQPINIQPNGFPSPINIQPNGFPPPINIQPINIQPNGFPPEFLQLFTDRQTSINSTIKFEARLIGTLPLNVSKKTLFFFF